MKRIFLSLSVLTSLLCHSQVRISGAFGASSTPVLVAEAKVGYDFKKVSIQTGLMSYGFQQGVYHGITAGPILNSNESKVIPFVGIYRFSIGRTSSVDRYVKAGDTTVLSSGLRTNGWAVPFGIQIIRQHFYVNSGYIIGDQSSFYLTLGVTHLFR